ncbi:MAG: IS1380 family transposase [Planctomycetota bacterium]
MSLQPAQQFVFGFCGKKSIQVEQVDENLSSDGGLIAFYQLDQKLGWTDGLVKLISDPRTDPAHSALSILRQRVFGIIAGYEDQNDHDSLRSDPVFKLIAGQSPDGDDLVSQPTISRLENSVTARNLLDMEDWFIERFVESFEQEPAEITLDIDTFDDPAHGNQQLVLFHGFYSQHQYQVRAITCAENDMIVLPSLLFGSAHASLAAADDLRRVIEKIRQRFPHVVIHIRADSGFAVPEMYNALERFHRVFYSIGYQMNARVKRESDGLLQESIAAFESTGEAQRNFLLLDYQAKTWIRSRHVIVKCEVQSAGTNRRAVVTNRPGVVVCPQGVYEEYADRGESENRNKELKCELRCDRLSDHRYMANLFRVMMHSLSANLLVCLRQVIQVVPKIAEDAGHAIPLEAQPAVVKRRHHARRRRRDPLGEGHACTWRTHVIKVACRVVVSMRRVRLQISSSWPWADHLRRVAACLLDYHPPDPSGA